ncbi:MAG: hypothetical protein KA974_07575 [Saprospiraceae bacterium]|nr:hypothetical protein [Saprospiraceae bacterium]
MNRIIKFLIVLVVVFSIWHCKDEPIDNCHGTCLPPYYCNYGNCECRPETCTCPEGEYNFNYYCRPLKENELKGYCISNNAQCGMDSFFIEIIKEIYSNQFDSTEHIAQLNINYWFDGKFYYTGNGIATYYTRPTGDSVLSGLILDTCSPPINSIGVCSGKYNVAKDTLRLSIAWYPYPGDTAFVADTSYYLFHK